MNEMTAKITTLETKVAELTEKLNAMTTEKAVTKSTKSTKVENKKKRGKTGYNVFMADKDLRQEVKNGEEMKSTEIMRLMSHKWKELSEEDKKMWNDKASKLNEASSDEEAVEVTDN